MALWAEHHGVRRFASAKRIPCAQAWHHILSAEPDLEAKTSMKSGPREFVAAFHCSTWVRENHACLAAEVAFGERDELRDRAVFTSLREASVVIKS